MLDQIPTTEDMIALIGHSLYEVWTSLIAEIGMYYDIEPAWNSGGKNGLMSINTVVVVKHYVVFIQRKTT